MPEQKYCGDIFCAYGDSGLQNANINCNNVDECNLLCNGTDTSLLNINCMPNGTQINTCSDMKVICPIYDINNSKRCIIEGIGDQHRQLELFCKNSWNDINILNYSSQILSGGSSSMYCRYYNYNNSCLLNNGILQTNSCICEYIIPSDITSTDTPIPQGTDWVIIFCIVCIVLCLMDEKRR